MSRWIPSRCSSLRNRGNFIQARWQRLVIMLGGIIVNLILGFTIYSMVLLVWGETVLPGTHPLRIGGGRTPEANGL